MRRRGFLGAAIALGVLVFPAGAFAQAPRTWVSGVGDDANPCSRTAPCKTFAGAIAKTDSGGEIDALDSGGFGALTITKPITISATGVTGGVLVAGTNGFVISAGSSDHVTLKGLEFIGNSMEGGSPGINGVRVTSAGTVTIENSEIYGFGQNGIDFEPNNSGAKLVVTDTSIHDNGLNGVVDAPTSTGSGQVVLDNDYVNGNGCGVTAAKFGVQGSPNAAQGCGTNTSGSAAGTTTVASANTSISNNAGAGVFSNGSGATNYITSNVVTGNGFGLIAIGSGAIVSIGSNNAVFGNTYDGSPTSQVATRTASPSGPSGSSRKVELVTCRTTTRVVTARGKRRRLTATTCSGKTVSAPVKFTIVGSAVHATLTRAGKLYATGTMEVGRGRSEGMLTPRRSIPAGRYLLTLWNGRRAVRREAVEVR